MLKLVKRPNSPYWIARGTIDGRRIERSTGESDKAAAKRALTGIIAELTAAAIDPEALDCGQNSPRPSPLRWFPVNWWKTRVKTATHPP